MPDKSQEPMSLPPPIAPLGIPEIPNAKIDEEEELARQELARRMPNKAKLRELAKKNPPLPKWFDEEEAPPF